ncbi:MAG: SpoIIE family protein phosphatase [Nocardioides sp.]|nr:SpoIIE family protein phosphatase [Nocardioides sp.]
MLLGALTGSTVFAGLVLAGLAIYVWRHRSSPAGLSLAVVLVSAAWWASFYAIELSTSDLTVRGRWGDLKYVGICLLPPAFLIFVLRYTGRDRLVTRRLLAALAIEPVVVWTLLAVPSTHDLVRFYTGEMIRDGIPLVGSGPAFWALLVYSNALLVVATVMFVLSMIKLSRVYRVAAAILVLAVLLPWAANLLFNLRVGPFVSVDLTPFAFILGGGFLVWGLYREQLINLSSIAWELVIETTTEGVILQDAFGRISDVNPAGEHLLDRPRVELIGQDLDKMLVPSLERQARHFELQRVPLADPAGARSGELVMLRDITERTEAEGRLRDLLAERTRIATTLQSSLLPAQLPLIPDCELAACYAPAGDGSEIGGDFYDVFPIGSHRWGIAFGDVSGKGAEAAAVTALIRYTLRTLASHGADPSRVLARLNEVLLHETGVEQFCTVVYAVARATTSGMDLRICLAGHHPPLLRRSGGRVEPVGALGTALGLFPDPELTDTLVHLAPGDLFFLCTDGLIEARNGGELFGGERVATMLSQHYSNRLQPVLDRIAAAAHEFHNGPLEDDLAMFALRPTPSPRVGNSRQRGRGHT